MTELWASDGTSSGTAPLTVAGEAISGLNPTSITVFGQKAAFLGNDNGGNQGLWITDGTSAGTFELTPSHFYSPPIIQGMMALGSKLLFSAADSSGNQSLWITDGTLAGTTELTIPLPNDGTNTLNNTSLYPQLLATLGNRAIFLGDNANYNTGLWITDGTVAGTTELSTPGLQFPGSNGINPSDFIVLGNKLLFRGSDSVGRVGLWVTDGTSTGTQEITPANADFQGVFSDTSYTPAFVRAGNGVIFQGVDYNGHLTLWFTDGTTAGTQELSVTSNGTTISPAPQAGVAIGLPAAACFAAGTRLATPRGPVAIERLQAGDEVFCADGSRAPVIWRGHRRVDCRRHPRPHDVWPVRVRADAFGPGVPSRDVLLSPDHAVFADGVLVPVRYLLNGRTIAQEKRQQITYWHVELPRHAVVLAEGLPAESYLDTGNRGAFVEGGNVPHLHPDFALRIWEAQGCAPLVRDGAALTALRQWLLDRAADLGHGQTDDPDLRVIAAGHVLRPERDGAGYRLRLPPGTRGVRIVSRSAVPAETHADAADHRRLGVAVRHIRLNGIGIARDDARLGAGWHEAEPAFRWTDGAARLAASGGGRLDIELAPTGLRYWTEEDSEPARRVA